MSDKRWFRFCGKLCDKSTAEKPALKSANDNPWYCLATLHGAQPIDGFDSELAEKKPRCLGQMDRRGFDGAEQANLENSFADRTSHNRSLIIPDRNTTADFSHTHFDRPVNLANFQFPRPADFNSATFSHDVKFSGAFDGGADFRSVTFSGEADFSRMQFNRGADFQSATFSKSADFQFVSAFVNPNFRSATFTGGADFNHAKCSGSAADFSSATFSSGAEFASAEFINGANFGSATFLKAASFNAATFNMARFNAATFSDSITFINAKFTGNATFADARFEAQPPEFHGATMHEATEWHGVTWPKPPKTRADAQQQVYAYERLKQEMERLKKHEDEQKFFRKELRARRGTTRLGSGDWCLNLLYQVLSNYGHSIALPLIWIVVCFAIGYFIFAGTHVFNGTHLTRVDAATLSFGNIFSFLPITREPTTHATIVGLNGWAKSLGAAQSLVGVVLLFLLGLALRYRFRMR